MIHWCTERWFEWEYHCPLKFFMHSFYAESLSIWRSVSKVWCNLWQIFNGPRSANGFLRIQSKIGAAIWLFDQVDRRRKQINATTRPTLQFINFSSSFKPTPPYRISPTLYKSSICTMHYLLRRAMALNCRSGQFRFILQFCLPWEQDHCNCIQKHSIWSASEVDR